MWGTEVDGDVRIDKEKLRKALKAQEEKENETQDDDRKRKFSSLDDSTEGVTEEEMEAYRLRKAREDDPLLNKTAGESAGNGYDYVWLQETNDCTLQSRQIKLTAAQAWQTHLAIDRVKCRMTVLDTIWLPDLNDEA